MKVPTSARSTLTAALLNPRAGFVLALIAVALVAACQGKYPQNSLDPKTDFAETVHSLYVSIFWWTMVILAVVWSVLAYIVIRFRENPDRPAPRQVHGHLGMEIAWTIGPALIVVAIAIPTIQAVFRTQTPRPPRRTRLSWRSWGISTGGSTGIQTWAFRRRTSCTFRWAAPSP